VLHPAGADEHPVAVEHAAEGQVLLPAQLPVEGHVASHAQEEPQATPPTHAPD